MKRRIQKKMCTGFGAVVLLAILCLPFGLQTVEASPQGKLAAKRVTGQQVEDNLGAPVWNGVVRVMVRGSLIFGAVVLLGMGVIILKLPEQSITLPQNEEKKPKR